MDTLDLIIEQSNQPSEMEEIEHWCPVCDRLITPTCTLVAPPPPAHPATVDNASSKLSSTEPTTPTIPSEHPTTPTTPIHKRKSALRGVGGRPGLYRSRTSMHNVATGTQHKKKLGAAVNGADHGNRSNPNLIHDNGLSTQVSGGGGADVSATTAPRTKSSPMGNRSHSDNAKIDEDFQESAGLELRIKDRSDRRPDPQSREDVPSAGIMKRKASAPDVNAGPRLKPLTKSKLGNKPRPKSLNLTTAQLFGSTDLDGSKTTKTLDQSAATAILEPPTAVDPQAPTSTSIRSHYTVEDLRRRLYCSEECYNVDLKGEKFDIYRPPSPSFHESPISATPAAIERPFEVKRNLSCEMPWLWTNTTLPRRMAPTRNHSWVDSSEESEYGNKRHSSFVSETEPAWSPFPQRKSGPIGVTPRKPVLERKQSKPLDVHEVEALRKMAPSFSGARRATLMAPIDSPADSSSSEKCGPDSARSLPSGAPMRKARPLFEDEKNEHRLFFRRMPGKVDAAPVTMPPLFVVEGQWTETPPPGFDYAGFMAAREKERRRRQTEITQAMLLKKKADDLGQDDEVARRHHETVRRKKHVHAEKGQYERRHSSVHGAGYYDDPQPGKQGQPWWHVDEREDWKAYWAARDAGLEDTTFEQWQVQRHAERVKRVEKEQARKRFEDDKARVQKQIANRTGTDGKKVAKRPLLIRVASQPTISDVNLVGQLYEENERTVQHIKERKATLARINSSSSETSPLGMKRTKALPLVKHSVESTGEPKCTTSSSSFMRGQTLCIPGFVVDENRVEATLPKDTALPLSPRASEFVFPLVAVPGSVESSPMELPTPAKASPMKGPLSLNNPQPNSTLGNPPGLCKPHSVDPRSQLKKSNTLPLELSPSQLQDSVDATAGPSPRRRVQSLKSMTLTVPDPLKVEEMKRSSLLVPRSPLGLHSISAAELSPQQSRGRPSSIAGSNATSAANRSSTSRSRQAEPRSGSHRRTLKPHVDDAIAAASLSPTFHLKSEQALTLALQGIPTEVLSGSPEIVTAVSGAGSSGSSGEESSWSRAEMQLSRKATIKATSTMKLPRTARGLMFTQVRPKSMGQEPEKVPEPTAPKVSNEPPTTSPLSYSASLLHYYSEFRSGSVPNAPKSDAPFVGDNLEQESHVGKRRSLWGIFGSVKP